MLNQIKLTINYWSKIYNNQKADNVTLYASAITYYVIFAFAPIVMVLVALGGVIFGPTSTRLWLSDLANIYFGPSAVLLLQNIFDLLSKLDSNFFVLGFGLIFIFYGISGLFTRLHEALSNIFHLPDVITKGLVDSVFERIKKVTYLIIFFSLILVTIVVNSIGSTFLFLGKQFLGPLAPAMIWIISGYLINVFLIAGIFTIIYMLASKRRLSWMSAWTGGLWGSILFSIANTLFGFYLSFSSSVAIYGVASFLVVFLLWINYFILTMFLGAEIAKQA